MQKKFTLNMAKSRLSVGYTGNNNQFVSYWDSNGTFEKVNTKLSQHNCRAFVLLDGPPYANGPLHLGHALNKNFKDLVVKSRWFNGQAVNFRPGWDCHGLPLELAVEKKHGRKEASEMKTLCKELALTSVENHKKGFKSLGVLGQWDNPYLTLSQENLSSTWKTLADLVSKNLLVYKQYPVHYCPACASSLASAELETLSLVKHSLYFKVQLQSEKYSNLFALVWTTTPWTLPMNQALAFNETFEYEVWHSTKLNQSLVLQNSNTLCEQLKEQGFQLAQDKVLFSELLVKSAVSPLTKKVVPVLAADFVEEGKTGFVHMALAHGPEDFELGVKNGLTPLTYLNKFGQFNTSDVENLQGLHGLNQEKSTEVVLNLLKEYDLDVHYSHEMQEQNVCWRHKKGVFYNATWQVFLNLEEPSYHLKDKVKSLLDASQLNTDDKNHLSQMLLTREHWCLSRQRTWGCEMNLLVNSDTHTVSPLSKEYLLLLANNQEREAQLLLQENPEVFVFKDVLDVWFDSGNVVNNYFENHGAQDPNYVVDLALEGKDQYRGWFQSMMWLCVAKNNMLPYKQLFCHGFVLNTNKDKLSKSAGNSQGLEYYLDKFGADTLHLWVANQESGKDAVFSEDKLKEVSSLYSRLRLTLRFLSSNLYSYDYQQHKSNLDLYYNQDFFDLERFMLKQMQHVAHNLRNNFAQYNFKDSLNNLYEFCNKYLSNFFFDYAKNPLYLKKLASEERLKLQCGMYELFLGVLDMVKVFAPFVAEEFYQDFFGSQHSVFEEHYFTDDKMNMLNSLSVSLDWESMMLLRKQVLGGLDELQKQKLVKARTEVSAKLYTNSNNYLLLQNVEKYYRLRDVFNVSHVYYHLGQTDVQFEQLSNNSLYQKCPKCWSYELVNNFNNEWNVCSQCEQDEKE